ncbi:hypothetical protein B0T13DRAFT_248722 [Neurospora crassa]|nr:hypothetical protein B0T13DRAFT_248722 [Neurospora crassa]
MLFHVMLCLFSCHVMCVVPCPGTLRNPFLPHPAANHHFTKEETCLDAYPKNRYGTYRWNRGTAALPNLGEVVPNHHLVTTTS